MLEWLYRRCQERVKIAGLDALNRRVDTLEEKLELYRADAHNLIFPILKKINLRESMRKYREKEEEEEEESGGKEIPLNNPMFLVK
jgi:hypothetical protein